jgi:hypothetical protein
MPIGVVAGTMGYFCWSHLAEPVGPVKKPPKVEGLSAADLSPPAPKPLDRDPFQRPKLEVAVASEPGSSEASTDPMPETAVADHEPAVAPTIDLSPFVLNGAYVSDKSRMAVINGRVYVEGEALEFGNPPEAIGTIKSIGVHRVLVSTGNVIAALTYRPLEMTVAPQVAEQTNPPPATPPAKTIALSTNPTTPPRGAPASPQRARPSDAQ